MRNLYLPALPAGAAMAAMPRSAAAPSVAAAVSVRANTPTPMTPSNSASGYQASSRAKIGVLLVLLTIGMVLPATCRAQNAYIANSATNSISVINTAQSKVVATLSGIPSPYGTVVSPIGGKLYVGQQQGIATVDTTTNQMVAEERYPGIYPEFTTITPDGKTLYMAIGDPDTGKGAIAAIDTASRTVLGILDVAPMPYPTGIAIAPDGSTIYASFSFPYTGTVVAVDIATNSASVISGPAFEPGGMAISPDGSRLYVGGNGAPGGMPTNGSVVAIDTATKAVLATISIPGSQFSFSNMTLAPDGSRLYVATVLNNDSTYAAGVLSVIDTTTDSIITAIPLDFDANGVDISPDGSRVYIPNYYGNSLAVLDTGTLSMRRAQMPVGGSPVGAGGNFIIHPSFAGTPGDPTCRPRSRAALAVQFGSFDAAAAALGFYSPTDLRRSMRAFCGRSDLAADEEGR